MNLLLAAIASCKMFSYSSLAFTRAYSALECFIYVNIYTIASSSVRFLYISFSYNNTGLQYLKLQVSCCKLVVVCSCFDFRHNIFVTIIFVMCADRTIAIFVWLSFLAWRKVISLVFVVNIFYGNKLAL